MEIVKDPPSDETEKADEAPETEDTTPKEPPIADDLKEKLGALAAIVETNNLLNVGMFQVSNHMRVVRCGQFLNLLHSKLLDEAFVHPDSDRVPDLVQLKAVKNGKAN